MSKDEKYQSKKYSSPENLSKSTGLHTDMNFYYVMKETEDGEYALLCNGARVNSAQSFYGWVNKSAFVEWNGRICLEPNWDVQYNKNHNGQKVNIYFSANMESDEILDWREYSQSNGDINPAYQYRMPPNEIRYPLLDIEEERNFAKCLYFIDRTYSFINGTKHNGVASNLKKILGEKGYKNWLLVKAITLFEGYVPLKVNEGEDYWNAVLFLSRDELCQLLNDLKPSYEIAKVGKDDRKPFVDAMRNLVKAHSKLKSNKEIDKLDENQLLNLIYGIDKMWGKYNHMKLKDIANPTVMSPIDYMVMLHKFCENYEKLLVAYKDGYTYSIPYRDVRYYWIPIEELPFLN